MKQIFSLIRDIAFVVFKRNRIARRIFDRHSRQTTTFDSQHGFHVTGARRFWQLRILRVANAKSGIRGFGGGGSARLDTATLRARVYDRPRPGHIANFLAIDWRTISAGVSRPRFQH